MKKNSIIPNINGIKSIKTKQNYDIYYIDGSAISNNPNVKLTNPYNNERVIYYIIENGEFKQGIYLFTDQNINVIFKNCCFHKIICINSYGNIEFKSNKYYADAEYPTFPKYFFNSKSRSLRFTDEIFSNASYQNPNGLNIVGMNVQTKFLTIDESLIKFREENGKIKIKAQETIIFNSTINVPIINLDSDDIYNVNSTISSQFLNITNKNNSELEGINADNFTYNGEVEQKAKVFSI